MKFFLIIILLFFSSHSLSNDLFNSKEYILEFTSNDIFSTKENKINQIKINSFKLILKRILTKENYLIVDKKLNLEVINNFVLNLNINDEKIINNNYYSKVKVNFNKNTITKYLFDKKINFVDSYPNKFLLVILDENNFDNNLLTKKNIFYRFLYSDKSNLFKDYFIVPKLDYNDRFIYNINNFKQNDLNQLIKLSQKYNSEHILLIHSRIINNKYNVKTYFIYDKNNFLIDENDFENIDYINFFKNLKIQSHDQWKKINEIDTTLTSNIECQIITNNINELKYIRNILNNVIIIKSLDLKLIKFNNNNYNIIYYGDIKNLEKYLLKSRLYFFKNNQKCQIKLI